MCFIKAFGCNWMQSEVCYWLYGVVRYWIELSPWCSALLNAQCSVPLNLRCSGSGCRSLISQSVIGQWSTGLFFGFPVSSDTLISLSNCWLSFMNTLFCIPAPPSNIRCVFLPGFWLFKIISNGCKCKNREENNIKNLNNIFLILAFTKHIYLRPAIKKWLNYIEPSKLVYGYYNVGKIIT